MKRASTQEQVDAAIAAWHTAGQQGDVWDALGWTVDEYRTWYETKTIPSLPVGYKSDPLSKHDDACLARRDDERMKFVCTCNMTDEQVAEAPALMLGQDASPAANPFLAGVFLDTPIEQEMEEKAYEEGGPEPDAMEVYATKLERGRKIISDAQIKVGDEVKIIWSYSQAYGSGRAEHTGTVVELDDWITCKPFTTSNGVLRLPLGALHHIDLIEKTTTKETT